MGGKPVVRIEHSDSEMRARDKINANFALLAQQTRATQVIGIPDVIPPTPENPLIKFTDEGGLAVAMQNSSGAPSVKGTVVTKNSALNTGFTLQTNEYDAVGVVYENGVEDGEMCWVVVSGFAKVLIQDGSSCSAGQLMIAAPADGRGLAITNPGVGLPATETHFKEIGHVWDTKLAGANVLALCLLHFN